MPAPSRTPSQPSSPKPLFVCGLLLSIIAAVMFAIFRTQAKTLPASNALVAVAASTSSATAVAAVSPTVAPVKPEIESPIDYSVSFEVVKVLSHDPASFTQGLTFDEGRLIESTGLYGKSKLRVFTWPAGKLSREVPLEAHHFGEGSAVVDDKIYVLTWKAKRGFVYNKHTLTRERSFSYHTTTGQGWGITLAPRGLIVSDGSSFLHFWDPHTLQQTSRIQVKDRQGRPVERLNELEFVNGELLANVWFDTRIARINIETGRVLGWINCASILHGRPYRAGDDVLNGIAQLPYAKAASGMPLDGVELLLTGKRWDKMYHVRLTGMPATAL